MSDLTIIAAASVFQGLTFYLLPAILAALRGHHARQGIGLANVFLGWTVLGWLICLGIACGDPRPPKA